MKKKRIVGRIHKFFAFFVSVFVYSVCFASPFSRYHEVSSAFLGPRV